MSQALRRILPLVVACVGLATAGTAQAAPFIDVHVATPQVRLVAAPPPPVVVTVKPGHVWVPGYFRTDRRGRRVWVEGHYEPRGRAVHTHRQVVVYR